MVGTVREGKGQYTFSAVEELMVATVREGTPERYEFASYTRLLDFTLSNNVNTNSTPRALSSVRKRAPYRCQDRQTQPLKLQLQ
jgi:hypothetical protein